jgi:hypothetical protein
VHRFAQSLPPAVECLACDLKDYCSWCPSWSYSETGTLASPVPYLCEIAKERKLYYGAR